METLTLVLIIVGILALIILVFGIFVAIIFRRRKLIYTRFLDETGKWIIQSWYKIDKTFVYDNCVYNYDIRYCTRDKHNRPIASYYKNNPEQIIFNYADSKKLIKVGTQEVSGADMRQILLTKIIKDIFSDDDIKAWFIIMIVIIIIGVVITGILIFTHNPECILTTDNQTIETIKLGVIQAIST
jgi:hypothetical protein